MPLIFFPLTDSGNLILWKITESVKELMGLLIENNRHDLLPNENFRLDKRRLEWLAVRCALISSPLLRQENIIYNELGKPLLKNGTGHLSISHSFPYVCLFFHESQNIGVDIEMMTEMGYCSGIENYSRYLSGRPSGDPPPTLRQIQQ